MNSLIQKFPEEINSILAKYPPDQKRAAVMPLLYVAQRERGYLTKQDLNEIGEILEISSTDVGSLIGFYTLYYEQKGGKHRIQVCNDLPCALRGADEFLAGLCENLGIQTGETTKDGVVTVEAVMCLAACDRAPMFQVQDAQGLRYFENQTVVSTLQLIDAWRRGENPPAHPVAPAWVKSASPLQDSQQAQRIPASAEERHTGEMLDDKGETSTQSETEAKDVDA